MPPLSTDVYVTAFPHDPAICKSIVAGVYFIEALQTILIAQHTLATFVTGLGNLDSLLEVRLVWFSVVILTGLGMCLLLIFARVSAQSIEICPSDVQLSRPVCV